ncbi:hypothetical protein FQR65_LT13009 [Abscondita terminalis]|nr:hypothetical protein FQR65_LT13009 [Abscondita terminalis]
MKLPQEVINKIEEHLQEMMQACINSTMNDDTIPSLQNDTFEMKENGKCALACVLKNEGFLSDNGKIDRSGAIEAVKRFTLNNNLGEYEDELVRIAELCTSQNLQDENECRTADSIQRCISDELQYYEGCSWVTLGYVSNIVKTITSRIVNIIELLMKREAGAQPK